MGISSKVKELDPIVVPIPDEEFDLTMDEWLVSCRGDEPRVLPRTTAELLDEARSAVE
ncbi:MAG: hypothetical protein JJE52_18405 [Acidimicrobiia bacterium]|nr:hypothetical protein [Acidimicrobiia bacterium]